MLRFNHLALSARLGFIDQVMDLLEEYQAEGHVFPEDFADWFEEAMKFLLEPRMHANEREHPGCYNF